MSDIVVVVDAITTAYNQLLESCGQRPLNDGAILFGREFVSENRAANSIVLVPVGGSFGGPKAISQAQFTTPQPPNANRVKARPLWTETTEFEVHVWGAAQPSSLREDVRMVQQLYALLMIACFQIATIAIKPGRFSWESQRPDAPARSGLGQYLVFSMTVEASVTDLSLLFVPPDTRVANTLQLNIAPGA
jgi:hypothetical protein